MCKLRRVCYMSSCVWRVIAVFDSMKTRAKQVRNTRKTRPYVCIALLLCVSQWMWVDYILNGVGKSVSVTNQPELEFIAQNISVGLLDASPRVHVPSYLYHANPQLAKERVCQDGYMAVSIPEHVFHGYGRLAIRDTPRQIVMLTMYDCELPLLELMLAEMGPVLHKVFIWENGGYDCFARAVLESPIVRHFRDKITYVNDTMERVGEYLSGMRLSPADLLLVTNVDEIVASQHLRKFVRMRDFPEEGLRISLRSTYYGFQWVNAQVAGVNAVVTWRRFQDGCNMNPVRVRADLCGSSSPEELPGIIGWKCNWCIATGQFLHKLGTSSQDLHANLAFLDDQRERGLWFKTQTPDGCYPSSYDFLVSFAPYSVIYSIPL